MEKIASKKKLENWPERVFTNYQHRPICANTVYTHTHKLKVTRDLPLYTTVVSICRAQTLQTRSKL